MLADEHSSVTRTLRDLLEAERDFEIIAETGNGLEAALRGSDPFAFRVSVGEAFTSPPPQLRTLRMGN